MTTRAALRRYGAGPLMDADRHLDELATIFEQALKRPVDERAAFLDEACRDDPTLRADLDSLLVNYEEAPAFFERLGDVVPVLPGGHPASDSTADPSGLIGTTVGRYQILEKLGAGGMGVVYKAHDTRLKRPVALKFLPAHLGQNVSARQRFEHEAQAASALDHANICTIYEVGEAADGQVFIAMGYYEGETLRQKIRGGALPVEETLGYVVQIARGLEKAHAKGIVHRDVKPANVMVTSDGVVKILDFGLAKMEELLLTRTGTTLGTVAYMSPEQTRGEQVDHRTDIWALGVLFYEMLTGERPFRGDYQQAIIYSVLNEEPASITTLNPDLPEALEHLVAMCLEKDQALRYATMADFLADLEVFVQGDGSSLSTTVQASRRRAVTRRQRVMTGTTVGLLLSAALVLSIPASREALLTAMGMGAPATRIYVAVLPFTSTLPEDQPLADGLMQAVTSLTAQLESAEDSLWVVPAGDILQREITTAREARKIFGVNKVLRGRVQHLGATREVILELEDPDQPRIMDSATLAEPSDPAFQEDALNALARLLGVPLNAQTRQEVNAVSTTPDAYAFYLQGQGYLQRLDKEGNLDNAIMLFTQAVEEDSLYALAQAGLCEATWEKYRKTNDTRLADQAIALCDAAARFAGDQAAVLIPLGSVYLRTGQARKAERTLLRARALEPNNPDVYRWLGRVYDDELKDAQAEDAYRRAIALKPNIWIYYNDLGNMLYYRGRYEEAGEQFEQASRLTPDNHLPYNALALVKRNLNQTEEAKRLFRQSIALQPNALAYRNLGHLYFRDRQYADAVRLLEAARDLDEEDLFTWSWLGHAYYWAGDRVQARAAWQRLITMATPKLAVNPKDDFILRLLADAHAALGNREQSTDYLQRLLAVPHDAVSTKYYIGRTYEMLGQRELALIWIEQALENRFDPLFPDRDPWLEDLRKSARYQALRKRFIEASEGPAT